MENFEKKFEFDEAAIQLFKALEKENSQVKDCLIRSYKGLPVSLQMKEDSYNYFITHSIISLAIMANPGSSIITEILYDGLPSPSSLDNFILQSKSGKAIKSRLIAIEKEFPRIIEDYRNRNRGEVLIGNLGSGPGRDIINVLSTNYRNVSNVRAVNIDKDLVALRRGRRMAIVKGVDHLIDFVEGNFLKYKPNQKFDIILLVGILCPLKIEACINLLKVTRKLLKKEGCLLVSNVSKRMLEKDPFTYFLMSQVGNWKLVFKTEEELKQIYKKAGYNWKEYFTDSYGFHIIGVGSPRFYF